MVRILPFGLRRVGEGKIGIRVDGLGLEVGLLPVELPVLRGAEAFHGHVEVGDLKLVVKRADGMVVKGFGKWPDDFKSVYPLIRETIDIGNGAVLAVGFNIREPVEQSLLPQKLEGRAGRAQVVLVRLAVAE